MTASHAMEPVPNVEIRTLPPALSMTRTPEFPGATWIGLADDPPARGTMRLDAADGFTKARLLVRSDGSALGFAEVPIVNGCVDAADAWAQMPAQHPAREATRRPDSQLPGITVAICTRDRVDMLARALESVLRQDYPDFDILVVDNSSSGDAAERYVDSLDNSRVRVIYERSPGLSRARNTAVRFTRKPIIAFTDDDVFVDSAWLRGIGTAFAANPSAACVTGLVPTGELTSATHAYFDRRVGWAKNLSPQSYSLADPPANLPLFPFQIGMYGTGANFAMERDVVIELGGFNEILGAGAPTKGGEDLDMFFRVIRDGRTLMYEPSAIVWHRHRDDVAGLVDQSNGYGVGLGAWLTTTLLLSSDSRKLAMRTALRNLRVGLRLATSMWKSATPDEDLTTTDIPADIGRGEMIGILSGPWAYFRGWREGRVSRPLAPRRAGR